MSPLKCLKFLFKKTDSNAGKVHFLGKKRSCFTSLKSKILSEGVLLLHTVQQSLGLMGKGGGSNGVLMIPPSPPSSRQPPLLGDHVWILPALIARGMREKLVD